MRTVRSSLASLALVLGLVLPFVSKPVHIDDANFLALAQGAALDPWRPHAVEINWQGSTERAFDVLSNPPGIAWWLAPWREQPIEWLHLSLLPWLILALWGAWRLGQRLAGDGQAGLLVLGTAPVALLAAQALTPDLPLYACALAGVGGFLGARRHAWAFALLAGCAALFRYSGVCLVPLLLLAGYQRGRVAAAMASLIPITALALHDLSAYGAIHLTAMGQFQAVSNTPRELFRKGAAALAMLGGVGVLPALVLRPQTAIGGLFGLLVGLTAALISGQSGVAFGATLACCAAGGLAVGALRLRSPEDRLLAAWTLGGLTFLLSLRFAAARYWLPFLPGPALAALRLGVSRRRLALAVAIQALVALGVSIDDQNLARAQERAAREISSLGTGTFAGHWGWQYAMEAAGWRPLEEDALPEGLFAVDWIAWPQEPAERACLVPIRTLTMPDHFPGPRVHTAEGGANIHAYLVAGDPPVETYAPWSFSNEPYDRVTLYRPCGSLTRSPQDGSPP